MNTDEMDALFAKTLGGAYDDDDAWSAVSKLRSDGNREVFDRAASWCLSDDSRKRSRGAAILCQLQRTGWDDALTVLPEWMFREESYSLMAEMLKQEKDPEALSSEISALGHLANASAVPLILQYQGHVEDEVRFAVSFALGCFPNDPQSVSGLIRLTADPDDDVRDWAVFGLGVQGEADSFEIREALFRCLKDPNREVREEAAVGLGKRRDPRVIPILVSMLQEPEIDMRVTEAASNLLGLNADPADWTATDYLAALNAAVSNN